MSIIAKIPIFLAWSSFVRRPTRPPPPPPPFFLIFLMFNPLAAAITSTSTTGEGSWPRPELMNAEGPNWTARKTADKADRLRRAERRRRRRSCIAELGPFKPNERVCFPFCRRNKKKKNKPNNRQRQTQAHKRYKPPGMGGKIQKCKL
jgi:hypothetical protein